MIAPARLAAYDTLLAVERGGADLPAALAHARSRLTGEHAIRDRALAGEIAAGTLRWQAAFDAILAAFSGRKPASLDREVVVIARFAMFQLLHLDRVPASAVVDDAVQLTKRAGKGSASGFVNAVLRRVLREHDRLPLPPGPPLEFLSVTLSHPRWLASRWLDRYGQTDAAAWMRFDNASAPLTLRANPLRLPGGSPRDSRDGLAATLREHGVETTPGAFAPDALIVRHGNPLLTSLADRGHFFVQDEASQLVGLFVDARPGERIFDTCASPGGKTTLMAAAMDDRGAIVAADVRGRRLALLTRAVAASGARCIRIIQANARAGPPLLPVFDAVLVDAPCSGLGTLRRDPDIKWRRQESDLPGLAAAQLEMLTQAAAALRPGGRVIYSTCSSEPEENTAVVAAFLAAHPRFERRVPAPFMSGRLADLVDADGALATRPDRHGLEGFYAACLVNS